MSEMVERVARAICEKGRPGDWGELGEGYRDGFRAKARAAIAAMREPTGGTGADMSEELAAIKARHESSELLFATTGWHYAPERQKHEDRAWLLGEIEHLRAENAKLREALK